MFKKFAIENFTKASIRIPDLVGILCVIGAMVGFSTQDTMIKTLSGDYPLHQIVLIRSLVAMLLTLGIVVPLEGGYSGLRTKYLKFHFLRGFGIVIANLCYFASIATLSLAQATSIFFVSPLFITILSAMLLRNAIGLKRWFAVFIGLAGVLVITRPGTEVFQWASLLPILAALSYALVQISTRVMGRTEKASTMSLYIQITMITVSGSIGLLFGNGQYANSGDPTLEFLFRAWVFPSNKDLFLISAIGGLNAIGGYLIMQGYRLSEPARVAPFEYISVVFAILWSLFLFQDHLDFLTWMGILFIVGSGIYTVYNQIRR